MTNFEHTISLEPPRTTEEIIAAIAAVAAANAAANPRDEIIPYTIGTTSIRAYQHSPHPRHSIAVLPPDTDAFTPNASYASVRVNHPKPMGSVWMIVVPPEDLERSVVEFSNNLGQQLNGQQPNDN